MNAFAVSPPGLRDQGIQSGDRVALNLPDNSIHLLCSLAVMRAGLVSVSLDNRAPARAQALTLDRISPAALLGSKPSSGSEDVPYIHIDTDWIESRIAQKTGRAFPVADADIAGISLSSGTTGEPKGILITHANILARKNLHDLVFADHRDHLISRFLSCTPMYFSATRNFCIYCLVSGKTVVLRPPLMTGEELADCIRQLDIQMCFLVPEMLRLLMGVGNGEAPIFDRSPLLIYGGSFSSREEKNLFARRFCGNSVEVFASSGSGLISILSAKDVEEYGSSVGRIVSPDLVEIVGDEDQPLAEGSTGRVRSRGEQVSPGFFPEVDDALDERLVRGFYYPGEIAAIEDGFLYLHGRASSLIVRGGVNIYPEEIENVLVGHPEVATAAVTAMPSARWGEEPVALVVLTKKSSREPPIEEEQLLQYCRSWISPHKAPRYLCFVDSLPMTGSGKISRTGLKTIAASVIGGADGR